MDRIAELIDVKELLTAVVAFVPKVGAALLVLVAFWLIYRVSRPGLRAALHKADFHEALIQLMVDNLYRYAIMIVSLVMAADQLGINVGAALAGLGVAGIALGFAAQDSVANVISGIMIFWDKPFIVGDWIRTEGNYGKVTEITLRSTRIRTNRNTYVVIPNKSVIDAVLENYSKHGELRIDVPIGIAYKEDIRQAREVLLEAVRKIPGVMAQPQPDVVVESLGDSSVNLLVRAWIETADEMQPKTFVVVEASKLALDAAGIQIPYPHLQLFVDDVEERVIRKVAPLRSLSAG
ncbi:MAG TPA: mechanosensitive ion channel family protein [Steroidobacteraceae bacterium]|nr:mechanosensitive ion channel family protein [Xanthomonadales bacterium]HSF78116.1 mechanosensitive ion channel family protein [Steroidobacteraceae bacterium]